MRLPFVVVVVAIAVGIAGAACGDFGGASDANLDPTGSGNFGAGGYGGSGAGGIGNAGGNADESFNYTEHCGGGCVPATDSQTAECSPDGAGGAGGGGGAGGAGTGGAGGGGAGPPEGDCKLAVDTFGEVSGVCKDTAPDTEPGALCLDSEDCGPGQGCVSDDGVSKQCRPYCCGDVEDCHQNQYCALQTVAEGDVPDGAAPPQIPVCVEAKDCALLMDSSCEPGLTCTIVRLDGTVSCVPPGTGLDGDACPCAQGHFCDTTHNVCLRICRIDGGDECPPGSTCQSGGISYPENFGACIALD